MCLAGLHLHSRGRPIDHREKPCIGQAGLYMLPKVYGGRAESCSGRAFWYCLELGTACLR